MRKDPKIFLKHILESVKAVEDYVRGVEIKDFLRSGKTMDAVVRRIEIIGEATKNLPADFKLNSPHIPWKKIAGMRDNLIHEYFGVNEDLVWKVVKKDLPELKKEIEILLK